MRTTVALFAAIAISCVACFGAGAAPVFTPASTSAAQASAVQGEVRLTIAAQITAGQARSHAFVAEISGGRDQDLYCQATTWAFGDGPGLTMTPSCAPWTPETKVARRFERSHTYERSGKYDVTFSYGSQSATLTLDVP